MRRDILIFLFLLGVLFFSWPIMSIFRENIAAALFVLWFVFILLVYFTTTFSGPEDGR